LQGLMSNDSGLAKLMESFLNQVLEAKLSEYLGAQKHERNEERSGYRNGHRVRVLSTRIGDLYLQVPQTREGNFSAEIFNRYQRSEQAFVLSLMEMVVQGVSTRKVTEITERLCGVSFSKSTVSALCEHLEPRVQAFNERPLKSTKYPFLMVDAIYIKTRDNDRVVSRAGLIASGIREDGVREILGLQIGDSESYDTWESMFKWLKNRGLTGVLYVISDAHHGLKEAAKKQFQGSSWQRCQVHLMRSILATCSLKMRPEIAEHLKNIFYAVDMDEARRRLHQFCEQFEKKFPKAVKLLEEGFEDAMAVMALPAKYRKRLRTTNMQERLNEEIRRRERVIRIFPNDASANRLIGALLAEQNERWLERKYLDMDEFHEWLSKQNTKKMNHNVVTVVA
jgi:putative transposase